MIKKLRKLKETIKSSNRKQYDLGESGSDYIELTDKPTDRKANIYVRYCTLDEFSDVKSILDFIREGQSICIIKIRPLKEKDINELKRAIGKIKKVCDVMEGGVVGMDEDYLIATPSFVKVFKGAPSNQV